LKYQIIKANRVFLFEAAELGKPADNTNQILEQIVERGNFWEREMGRRVNEVSMVDINLSLAKYIR
jgi:hypothetical protein